MWPLRALMAKLLPPRFPHQSPLHLAFVEAGGVYQAGQLVRADERSRAVWQWGWGGVRSAVP